MGSCRRLPVESTPSSAKDLGKKKPFVPQTEDCSKPIQKGQRTVHDELAEAEARMLSGAGLAGAPIHSRRIALPGPGNLSINYLIVGDGGGLSNRKPACVLVHGYGCGVGSWAANYAALASNYVVYSIDMVGFGRSSRPEFSGTDLPADCRVLAAEAYFVQPIERWRAAMCSAGHSKLERPVWIAHSFGGYVMSCYALEFPTRVERLILADPWGIQKATDVDEQKIPAVLRALVSALPSPLSPIRWIDRASGLGKSTLRRAKHVQHQRWHRVLKAGFLNQRDAADAPAATSSHQYADQPTHAAGAVNVAPSAPQSHWQWCFELVKSLVGSPSSADDEEEEQEEASRQQESSGVDSGECRRTASRNDVTDYLYYLGAVPAFGGDHAFKTLCRKGFFHFAANPKEAPLAAALADGGVLSHVTLDFIYGQDTWIDIRVGERIAGVLGASRSIVVVVANAGHHVYLDVPVVFNAHVLSLLAARTTQSLAAELSSR